MEIIPRDSHNNDYIIKLKINEAKELRDSLDDLIKKGDFHNHHHISEFDLFSDTIKNEITVCLYE